MGFDGLRSSVTRALRMSLSGITHRGSGVGGFFTLGDLRLTPELLARWIQLGAVSGVACTCPPAAGSTRAGAPPAASTPTGA